MAITEKKLPEAVSLSRSPLQVMFKSNLPQDPSNVKYIRMRILDGGPTIGQTFSIIYGDISETFTVQTAADDTGRTLSIQGALTLENYWQLIATELQKNAELFTAFTIEPIQLATEYFIKITPRTKTDTDLTLDHDLENVTATVLTYDDAPINPHLLLLVEAYDHTAADYAAPVTHALPLFSPEEFVTFDVHRDFDLRHALPAEASIGGGGDYIAPCRDNWTKYRLRWAEMQGRPPVAAALDDNDLDEFFLIHGGNAFMLRYDMFWTFWKENGRFSTAQAKTKTITHTQPEWLYWIGRTTAEQTLHLLIEAIHRSGSTSVFSRGSYAITKGEVICCKVGFEQLALPYNEADPIVSYNVRLRKADEATVSETFTFYLAESCGEFTRFFLFGNSLGGCDTVRATGKMVTGVDITTQRGRRIVTSDVLGEGRAEDFFMIALSVLFMRDLWAIKRPNTSHICRSFL
jgi:hypothetical protein